MSLTNQPPTEAKAGARHSAADNALLKDSRQKLREIDANLVALGTPEDEPAPEAAPEANTLKAIAVTDDELRVANYIVLFGGQDLTGERFTPQTQLESEHTALGQLDIDWEHGQQAKTDGLSQRDVLGHVDWKTARADERGVWVERVLNRRQKYVKWLQPLIEAGLVGTSSQAVASGVRKSADGEILVWPLYRDALTVQPAEPRMMTENVVSAMKALGLSAQPKAPPLDSESGPELDGSPLGDEWETLVKLAGVVKSELGRL